MAEIEQAFDEFLAAEPKHWLAGRFGEHIESVLNEERSAELPADVREMPRLESNFFHDAVGTDAATLWYLPEFTLIDDQLGEDPEFAFDAEQPGSVAEDGGPFNTAVLKVSIDAVRPAHLSSAEAEFTLRPVPDLDPGVTLIIPLTGNDGVVTDVPVEGTTKRDGESGFVAGFELSGFLVEAAYAHLTRSGGLRLEFAPTYSGYQTALVTEPDVGFPVHGSIFHGFQFEVFGDGGNTAGAPFLPLLFNQIGRYVFFPSKARFHRTLRLGLKFNTDDYRSRFTITSMGLSRHIIDIKDLSEFAGQRSEYRELTTLGNISDKYPSVRRVFFGQVSGTVIAVPAAYGILVTAQGARASCDSIVDESPATLSGCRFHFTFTVAPMVDPIDMARLRADVPDIPEAVGRTLRVALPGGLDSRTPSTLDGFPAGRAAFADGDGTTVTVSVDITDDRPTPATTTVNLFLQQLAATGPPPLFGSLAVRLDDVFPQPVRTSLLLNLRNTAHSDELSTTREPGPPPSTKALNHGPLDLKLLRCADIRDGEEPGPVVPLGGQVLAALQTTTLVGVGAGTEVAVQRALEVAAPLPKAAMLTFLAFRTHTVQEVQHPLTVNAAGLNFTAEGVSTIKVDITLAADPGDSAPSFTLSPSHTVDFVHVSLPVDSAVRGLDSTVLLTLTTTSGSRTVSVVHDFVDAPILVVTSSTIH
ncbi:hypothetical protein [Streptomyces tanashiensis]|uniref:hypothetical protein n=1 Tax=Streptomyces tanashiensis TaxID=67367 RepID=UPI00167E0BB6|nr:hypothetical protein [Streptomyces tanashiensis]GGY09292.1 hypothetical protein GCM10010299_11120 [Streptomyces tanashiensis]